MLYFRAFILFLLSFQLTAQSGLEPKASTAELHQPLRNLVIKDPVAAYDEALLLIRVGEKKEQPRKEAIGRLIQGNVKWVLGDYEQALSFYLVALPLFEQLEDTYGLIATYNDISLIHSLEGNFSTSLAYLKKAYQLNDDLNDRWLQTVLLSNVGDLYFKTGKPDSAELFSSEALNIALTVEDRSLRPFIYNTLGLISLEKGEITLAREYFQKSLNEARQRNDKAYETDALLNLGYFFDQTGQHNRAKYYYYQAYADAEKSGVKIAAYRASSRLHLIYDREGNIDSAYHFSTVSGNLRDSLLNVEKIKTLTQQQQQEEVRQAELEAQREAELERQHHLLEYEVIAVALLLLTGLAFVFRRVRVHKRLFEYWLVITLLILFETITLLIHNYAGRITHHSPLRMILILVLVAAILGPLHHYALKAISKHSAFKHIQEEQEKS